MKKLLILPLILFLSFQAQAQKNFRSGYIVNLQGDTLKGEVNYKGDVKSALECSYRANATATEQNFKPTELLGYGFKGGKIYEAKTARIVKRQFMLTNQFQEVAVTGNDSVNFMEVMVKGLASLYFMKDANAEEHYFLQKRNEPLRELLYLKATITDPATGIKRPYQSKLYVGVLKNAFGDCVLIGPSVEKTDFKPSALQRLFVEYNECLAPTKKVFTRSKSKSQVTWGALAGVSTSGLTIVTEDFHLSKGDYKAKMDLTGGIFADITLPNINEKLSINNAVYFTQRDYTSAYRYNSSDLAYSNYQVTYNFKYIRLETALRYTAPSGRFLPFGQLGLSNSYMLSGKEAISSTKYYLNYPPEEREDNPILEPIFRKHQLGVVSALGVSHYLPGGNQLFLQLNYEFNTGFTKVSTIGTRSHNLALMIGFGF